MSPPASSAYMDPSLPSAIRNAVHVVEDDLHLQVPGSLDLTDMDESELESSFIDDNMHDMNMVGDMDEWPSHECANCIVHKQEIRELKERVKQLEHFQGLGKLRTIDQM